MSDILVVGAGLAGLCATRALVAVGFDVTLLEASDAVGGRVRSDVLDGVTLDRGFQLHNPSYPEAVRVLDQNVLDLQPFAAGVVVSMGSKRHRLGDPRRLPAWSAGAALAPLGSPLAKVRFAAYALHVATAPADALTDRADTTTAQALAERGLSGPILDRVLRPFLAGVFGESELRTSRRFADLVIRSFVRGTPSVPAAGMQAIGQQLADALPPGVLRLNEAVTDLARVRRGARAVVVAADPSTASRLLGVCTPPMNALTTCYHLAPEAPSDTAALHVDGESRGPVINTVVMTNAAPTYAPGRHLVSSTVLGDGLDERVVRRHLATIYGVPTDRWEHVRTYAIPQALPAMLPPLDLRKPVALGDGLFVAGDWRDTSSIQGAMVSGRRAAEAVTRELHGRQ